VLFALATIYVVWGSTFIAVTIAVRDLPPLLSMAIRHLVAGAFLLAWALPRGDREGDRIGGAQVKAGLIFGGALFLVGHGGLAWAQQTVPAGVAALLVGTIPLWMVLLDRVVFGKRLHTSAYAGLVLGFVGLGFLLDPFGKASGPSSARSPGPRAPSTRAARPCRSGRSCPPGSGPCAAASC
jgi:drug/metabolite transporter (DMT)-like permease